MTDAQQPKKKMLMIYGHGKVPGFAEGKLNNTLFERAEAHFQALGYEIKKTIVEEEKYDVAEEIEKFVWADYVFFQVPCYWMGAPWQVKKYFDVVYGSAGDKFCNFDGRHREAPEDNYGTGGVLKAKYMLSVTYNAPNGAFNRPSEPFLKGKSIDDMWLPFHLTQHFVGMETMPTFSCHDVIKNPVIEQDFKRFQEHLEKHFK